MINGSLPLGVQKVWSTYATLDPRDVVHDQMRTFADASGLDASPDVHAAVEGRGARRPASVRASLFTQSPWNP